jgi:serine/threonine protein kinase
MYAMCTGHPPFRAETVYAVMQRIVHDTPRSIREQNPKIPEWLDQFILRLLDKEKEHRFASASEVAALLQEELAYLQNPVAVNRPNRVWFVTRPSRTTRAWQKRFAVAAVALVMVGPAAFRFLSHSQPENKSDVTLHESKNLVVDSSPSVAISTVPLWNADGTQEAKNMAAQLEMRMLNMPQRFLSEPDPWTKQIGQLSAEIYRCEMSDEFAPRRVAQ